MSVRFRLMLFVCIFGSSNVTLKSATGRISFNIRRIHLIFVICIFLFAMTYTLAFRTSWIDCFTGSRFHEFNCGWKICVDLCVDLFVSEKIKRAILFSQSSQCFRCGRNYWCTIITLRSDTLQMNNNNNNNGICQLILIQENKIEQTWLNSIWNKSYWIMSPYSMMPMCSLAKIIAG